MCSLLSRELAGGDCSRAGRIGVGCRGWPAAPPPRSPAMRLKLIPPPVQPDVYPAIAGCPDPGCGGRHVQLWQAVRKPIRDTVLTEVVAKRYRCPRCGRT